LAIDKAFEKHNHLPFTELFFRTVIAKQKEG